MATRTRKKKKVEVIARMKVMGRFYEAKGETVKEAIENLKPGNAAKGASLLILSKGDAYKERVLTAIQTMRLFSPSKLTRELALKSITTLFDIC